MNKLIALSVALLSLNLHGAVQPRPNISEHGLEGWGWHKGVSIYIEDYSKQDKTFDEKAISNIVELKLRLAGIEMEKPFGLSLDSLYINMMPLGSTERLTGYALKITPRREMVFYGRYGKEYIFRLADAMAYGGIVPHDYRPYLEKYMDQLLINYLKANPKKD